MKRSAPISFFGMSEAKKVDSFSLNLRRESLSSPPPPPAPPVDEEKGMDLFNLQRNFNLLFGLSFSVVMSRDERVSVLRVENDDKLARDGVVWARQVDGTINNGHWHCIF